MPAPWSLGGSPASLRPSGLVWSGDDGFVRGTWRPPSFVEKLLSGDGIEVTGDLARALVASQEESRKRLGDRKAILLLLDDLEHDTLVAFQDLCDKGVYPPVYAVGPFIRSCSDEAAKHRCMEWLDGQPDGSVLYMCFGNGGALSSRQILAWPLFAEQWINVVKLSSEGAGVALRLRAREDAGDGMVPREEETAAARELMAGENGAVVRKKAHELRVGAEKAAAADGPARRALAAVMDTWNGGSAHAAS
ncbi:hypothetical protein C2845_PM08G19200 [Panicum miliaceum]|uniref:Uncharacterized protein n=1 Tax=Panicum miliaceum TaxID=4540 RepID=A0A3L6R5Q4_PANMI|nr:hypothetical protein C2845_PM08G19200 [Panicum miliaceum]